MRTNITAIRRKKRQTRTEHEAPSQALNATIRHNASHGCHRGRLFNGPERSHLACVSSRDRPNGLSASRGRTTATSGGSANPDRDAGAGADTSSRNGSASHRDTDVSFPNSYARAANCYSGPGNADANGASRADRNTYAGSNPNTNPNTYANPNTTPNCHADTDAIS